MKPFDQLTSRQKFLRKNGTRLVLYGGFIAVLVWNMFRVVGLQEKADASVVRVEEVMMDYYRETIEQKDTVGMAAYMKLHLTPYEYRQWARGGSSM